MSGRPRGFGFVTFEDARDAADAVKDMDGYVVRYLLCCDTSDAKLRTMRALAHLRMYVLFSYCSQEVDGRRLTVNIAKARAPLGSGGGGYRGGGGGYGGGGGGHSGTYHRDGKADPDIDDMVRERDQARRDRDYGTADRIRDDLRAKGVEVDDRGREPQWYYR